MKIKKQLITRSKQLLFAALLFTSLRNNAQSGLSNLSFETWSTSVFGPAPTGWFGINASQQTTGAQQGNSFLRLSNNSSGTGFLMLGSLGSSFNLKGGAPVSQTPQQITGFYKISGMAAADSIGISSYTSKTGTIKAMSNLILTANKSSWTSFSMSFTVFAAGSIDTLFFMTASSKPSGGPANSLSTVFDLDNLSFGIPTSIDKRSLGTSFFIYPNPASSELNILSKEEQATSVLITGLDGKAIEEVQIEMEHTKIDLQNYSAGVYFYFIRDKEGKLLLTNKFIVSN